MALEENTMTTAMLKAMSNPLRREILSALNRYEYARATDLAEDLEVPANKLSFHLPWQKPVSLRRPQSTRGTVP